MAENMTARPRRTPFRGVQRFDHGAVLRRGRAVAPVVLNPTALALWELCDGSTTVEEMVTAVCDLFAIDVGQARCDVERALGKMRAAGVIA